jgi:hypothetical protein
VLAAAIVVSFVRDYASPASLLWPCVALLVCLAPLVLWRLDARLVHHQEPDPARVVPRPRQAGTPEHAGDITMEIPRALLQERLAAREAGQQHEDVSATLIMPKVVDVPAQRSAPASEWLKPPQRQPER